MYYFFIQYFVTPFFAYMYNCNKCLSMDLNKFLTMFKSKIYILNINKIYIIFFRCYCCALSLSPQSALLWHDLALCYLMQLQYDPSINHKNLASKSLAAAKHAIKLNPSIWIHWNLLGVICMSPYIKNFALAQHAYIMAIDTEINNAIVWCNLGTLYLYTGI